MRYLQQLHHLSGEWTALLLERRCRMRRYGWPSAGLSQLLYDSLANSDSNSPDCSLLSLWRLFGVQRRWQLLLEQCFWGLRISVQLCPCDHWKHHWHRPCEALDSRLRGMSFPLPLPNSYSEFDSISISLPYEGLILPFPYSYPYSHSYPESW